MIWIALTLCLGALIYSAWGLSRLCPPNPTLRWAVALVWLLCFVALVLNFVLRQRLSMSVLGALYSFGSSWLIVSLYVLMGLVVIDLLRCLPPLRSALSGSWLLLSGFALLMTLIFVYGRIRYNDKVRVPLSIKVDKPLSKPLKIVALSDLHLGYTIGEDELASWVELINREQADLILIAGDLVDGDVRPLLSGRFADELNKLNAPVYASLGNHEYIGGEADERQFLSRTKVQLLRDSVALFNDQVYIVGRDDRSNPYRRATAKLLAGLDRRKPIILLDHQPYALDESAKAGVDLQLSGHTHRGQVFPLNLIVDRMYQVSHGVLRLGATRYYVSSGLGIWGGKFRLGTQSEYVVITLSGSSFSD